MTYLITGGAGFIGANFVYYTLEKHPNARVLCLDALTYAGSYETLSLARGNANFKFVKGDITSENDVNALFEAERPDFCVNFAAETHVDRSIENPSVFLRTNIIGAQVLMDACVKYGAKRFHQVSTDEVYGDLPLNRPDIKFTEASPLKASSPYSASKAAADLLTLAYHRTYKLNVTISRCSNNYGEYQCPEKLIPLMITNALNDRPLPVYGGGENVRDWLHVKDHCAAIDLILRGGKTGEVYNIGGDNEMSNINVVKLILEATGKPRSLITHVTDRPGHDERYAIDASKIKTELNWLPETPFEEGVRRAINWYGENREWAEEAARRAARGAPECP